jgi:hypothetical protein
MDLIFVDSNHTAKAAQLATLQIPIVFVAGESMRSGCDDPPSGRNHI